MTGNEDLERKDDHLPKAAAHLLVESGIEVTADENGLVLIDAHRDTLPLLSQKNLEAIAMTPFQARLLSDALLEAASLAEAPG